jgi:hypothetical protein
MQGKRKPIHCWMNQRTGKGVTMIGVHYTHTHTHTHTHTYEDSITKLTTVYKRGEKKAVKTV